MSACRAVAGALYSPRAQVPFLATCGSLRPTEFAPGVRRALISLCDEAMSDKKAVRHKDLGVTNKSLRGGCELASLGFASTITIPVVRSNQPIGALLLLFPPKRNADDDVVTFLQTASGVLSSTAYFDYDSTLDVAAQLKLNQPSTTSIVLLGASVAHQLQGPVNALDLQLEEQKRLLQELRLVTDQNDTVVAGTVSELAELTDEVCAAVSRLRDTAQQLTQLGTRQDHRESVDLADITREAVAILRPWLEARGITLDTQLNPGGIVSVQRDSIMQVVLDMITIAAELGESFTSSPRVAVHTGEEGERVVLTIDDVGPALDASALRDIHEHPFSGAIPDERRRLVLRLAGDVAAAHCGHVEVLGRDGGGSSYRLVIPAIASTNHQSGNFPLVSTNPEIVGGNLHDVLIVDDDPVFSRSARRALKPHRVLESATASEAEFQLLQSQFDPSIVVCDLMLPGSDGTELHARIRDARPDLAQRFLFVTGGTLSKATADYIRNSGCLAFQKPFDFSRLRRHLSSCSQEAIANNFSKSIRVEMFKPITP